MKTTKLLSTLTAAAAMAVPAFAAGGLGTSSSPYTGEGYNGLDLSGPYENDTAYISRLTGSFVSGDHTFSTGIHLSDGLTINSGTAATYTFTGAITGSGAWTTSVTHKYVFTGDISGFTGTLTNAGNITFENTTGTATINAAISTSALTFGGSANYDISKALSGYNGSGTLTISTSGTVTVRGEVSDFNSIVVSSGSGLTVATDASVTLNEGGTLSVESGATLTLDTTLGTSAGTVVFATGATLILGDSLLAQLEATLDAADSNAVAIITASDITFNSTSLNDVGDDLDSLINAYVSAGDYLLTWTWDSGTLYASAVGTTPEPSMFGLFFGLGAIGLVATRRHRRKAT